MTPVLFPAIVSSVNIGYTYLWGQRTAVTNHNYFFHRLAYVRRGCIETIMNLFTPSTVVYGAWRRHLKIELHCKARIVCRYALLHFTRWCTPSQEDTDLHSLRKSSLSEEISVGENWGLRKAIIWTDDLQHNWGIILYIQLKPFCMSISLTERLYRWFMTNFQIKNILSAHLPKTVISILVNSDCIVVVQQILSHAHHMPAH